MKTPFTIEQFYSVFEQYNARVFPAQLILLMLGIAALAGLHTNFSRRNQFAGTILGFLWIWTGWVYHIMFFAAINRAAYLFGAAFLLQGIMILASSFRKHGTRFSLRSRPGSYTGYFLILFGLLIYPAIGYLAASDPLKIISLGLPCPTTIFTFGFFLLTEGRLSKYLLIIPSLWAVIGLSAAINFNIYQDFVMIIAAMFTTILLLRRKEPRSGMAATALP